MTAKRGIFESGQNLVDYSNNLDPSLSSDRYLGSGTKVVSSAEIAPNGKPEALVLETTSGGSNAFITHYFDINPDKYYTVSVWAKQFNDVSSCRGRLLVVNSGFGEYVKNQVYIYDVTKKWERHFCVIYTSSITVTTSTWVAIHYDVSSTKLVAYWGLSITETDTLYPYVQTSSSIQSDVFSNFLELYPTYKSKYEGKYMGKISRTLTGNYYDFGESSTHRTRLEYEEVTSAQAKQIEDYWSSGTALYIDDGIYPESYIRKITNKNTPIVSFDAECSSGMRCILEMESY
jgi:hypothetical protein